VPWCLKESQVEKKGTRQSRVAESLLEYYESDKRRSTEKGGWCRHKNEFIQFPHKDLPVYAHRGGKGSRKPSAGGRSLPANHRGEEERYPRAKRRPRRHRKAPLMRRSKRSGSKCLAPWEHRPESRRMSLHLRRYNSFGLERGDPIPVRTGGGVIPMKLCRMGTRLRGAGKGQTGCASKKGLEGAEGRKSGESGGTEPTPVKRGRKGSLAGMGGGSGGKGEGH